MPKKIDIPAIHDKDLRKILNEFKLAEKVDEGSMKCVLCGKIITWESIYALKVNQGELEIYCDDDNCIDNISKS